MKQIKTNAMRLLDQSKIDYEVLYYDISKEDFDGEVVSDILGLNHDICYKTLALLSNKDLYIMVIPVNRNIELKKAAKAVGVKNLEMLKVKDLRATVGYERGSVSPIGIKAKHKCIFDISVKEHEKIEISGGQMGIGLMVDSKKLIEYLRADIKDICKEKDDD